MIYRIYWYLYIASRAPYSGEKTQLMSLQYSNVSEKLKQEDKLKAFVSHIYRKKKKHNLNDVSLPSASSFNGQSALNLVEIHKKFF